MTAPIQTSIGGSASPNDMSIPGLINAGRQILEYFDRSMSTNRIARLAIRFKHDLPNCGRDAFFLAVCNEIQVSDLQKKKAYERAHSNPEWAKVIGYLDPTGEDAAWNADHPDCMPRGYDV